MSDEHGERRKRLERLKADVEAKERVLRDVLDFLSDDRHLTDKGIAEREALLEDIEAIRQEHRVD